MLTQASAVKPPAALLLRAINDDGITEDALDYLHDNGIDCPSGCRDTIITLAYAYGWREGLPSTWRG